MNDEGKAIFVRLPKSNKKSNTALEVIQIARYTLSLIQ